ncbi:type IV toxin-antitoxin system AbiEi family antitoxin domain-containing protein [Georgenia satyanarayanai]|uniref:type IV toxin-antitoxin system AbiEi family antitoxin domain-containing protein n=1 Tax=Georgenia satyanarayanai TaxID=860221 RepID=UPI0012647C62|nr:type IV toxin-antitoxin system AbiEi family antitoxin domain-containing protein [Georgenia satyanarayanai]
MDRRRIEQLAEHHEHVLTRAQLRDEGATDRWVRHLVDTGSWQRAYPGVYVTHSGNLEWLTRVAAALAYAGTGAAISHSTASDWWFETAATRAQRMDAPVEISVPAHRTVTPMDGLRIHRRRTMPKILAGRVDAVHPSETALDLVARAETTDDVIGILVRATRKVVHPNAMLKALERRGRVRGRDLVVDLLGEVADGVESPLELRYRQHVERAHGLPRAELQTREKLAGGWIRADCRYRGLGVRVELDGKLAHPGGRTDKDTWRDNAALLEAGEITLRYRWSHIAGTPCATAAQVARALHQGGWGGSPRPCGPACAVGRA